MAPDPTAYPGLGPIPPQLIQVPPEGTSNAALMTRPSGAASQSAAEATLGLVTVDILGLAGVGIPPAEQPAVAVTNLWLTGFEEVANTAAIMAFWQYATNLGGISILTTGARSGTRCLRIAQGTAQAACYVNNYINIDGTARTHVRFAFFVEQFSTTRSVPLLTYTDVFGNQRVLVALKATATGTSRLIVDADLELATDIGLATWYLIEIAEQWSPRQWQYRLLSTTGLVLETSAMRTTAMEQRRQITLGPRTDGPTGSGYAFRIDDFALRGGTSPFTDWLGYGRVGVWKLTGTVTAQFNLVGSPPQHTALDEVPEAPPAYSDRTWGSILNSEDRFSGAPVPPLAPGATVRRFTVGRVADQRSLIRIWPPLGPAMIEKTGTSGIQSSGNPNALDLAGIGLEWPPSEPGTTLANIQVGYRCSNLAGGNPEISAMWGTFDEDTPV
jgi:hypothetical protein